MLRAPRLPVTGTSNFLVSKAPISKTDLTLDIVLVSYIRAIGVIYRALTLRELDYTIS